LKTAPNADKEKEAPKNLIKKLPNTQNFKEESMLYDRPFPKGNLRFLNLAIFTFICFLYGCSTDTSPDGIIGMKAENVPEGVRLTFSQIPPDTSRLFIHFMELTEGGNAVHGRAVSVFTDIRGPSLERVKATGLVTCPFVKKGVNYYISSVMYSDASGQDPANRIRNEIKADSGIYSLNDIILILNETQTAVTLSQEPVFSSDVQFAPEKYTYNVTVKKDAYWGISYSETVGDNFSWDFSSMVDNCKKENIELSGLLPAYATASCNLNFDELLWNVDIASSDEFIVSF
jgi:hypothetical protein